MKFIKLTSESQLFTISEDQELNKKGEILTLINFKWEGPLDLLDVSRVGLAGISLANFDATSSCKIIKLKSNIVERSVWNPNREISRFILNEHTCLVNENLCQGSTWNKANLISI